MIREQRGLLGLVVRDGALTNYCRTGDSFIGVYEYRMKQAARNVCKRSDSNSDANLSYTVSHLLIAEIFSRLERFRHLIPMQNGLNKC